MLQHGDPGKLKPRGQKPGSGAPAHSPLAPTGALKMYESYEDEFGQATEVHYFRHPAGAGSAVKVTPRS